MNKPFEEVAALHVVLTGRSSSLKLLESKDFIQGVSIGVTAQIIPYIKLKK